MTKCNGILDGTLSFYLMSLEQGKKKQTNKGNLNKFWMSVNNNVLVH